MSNKIDTNIWVTQQALAKELGVQVQCINNWITRGKIEYMKIEGSRLTLVNKQTAPMPNQRSSKSTV